MRLVCGVFGLVCGAGLSLSAGGPPMTHTLQHVEHDQAHTASAAKHMLTRRLQEACVKCAGDLESVYQEVAENLPIGMTEGAWKRTTPDASMLLPPLTLRITPATTFWYKMPQDNLMTVLLSQVHTVVLANDQHLCVSCLGYQTGACVWHGAQSASVCDRQRYEHFQANVTHMDVPARLRTSVHDLHVEGTHSPAVLSVVCKHFPDVVQLLAGYGAMLTCEMLQLLPSLHALCVGELYQHTTTGYQLGGIDALAVLKQLTRLVWEYPPAPHPTLTYTTVAPKLRVLSEGSGVYPAPADHPTLEQVDYRLISEQDAHDFFTACVTVPPKCRIVSAWYSRSAHRVFRENVHNVRALLKRGVCLKLMPMRVCDPGQAHNGAFTHDAFFESVVQYFWQDIEGMHVASEPHACLALCETLQWKTCQVLLVTHAPSVRAAIGRAGDC